MKLGTIKPTVFFKRVANELRQLVRVEIEAVEAAASATLMVSGAGLEDAATLPALGTGDGVYDVYIADIREPGEVTFELRVAGEVVDSATLDWTPQRHWEVYLIQYAHHDLGYTDLPSNVHREYDGFYDRVLEFCDATEAWDADDAKFRYLVEQAWSIVHWVEHRPPEVVERLMHYVRDGRIEVTALFGNQTLELCGHEELVRLLYPAFDLAERYGFEISSAEHNDIPGFPWALAGVLRGAGVRYFSPGVPKWYFGSAHPLWDTERFLPLGIPAACWWEGPDGARVLLWSDLHGREWQPYNYDQAVAELPEMLSELQEGDYAYDLVSYTLRGGHRDNAPPTLRYAHMVRAWNGRWAYPRLINATNRMFLERFEAGWGDSLPVFRGDVPGTDYPVAATCTPRETAVDRGAHDMLLSAEKLASWAAQVSDYDYPRATLDRAYRETFLYDLHCWGFHDVGGPAQDAHWSENATRALRAAALAHDVAVKAANKIVDELDLPDDSLYLTVFNTLGHGRTTVVRAPFRDWQPCGSPMYWQEEPEDGTSWPAYRSSAVLGRRIAGAPASLVDEPFELIDVATGARVPYQIDVVEDPQAAAPWAAERVALGSVEGQEAVRRDLVFVAEDLPAMGYKVYRIRPCEDRPDFGPPCTADGGAIESDRYRLDLDPQTGRVVDVVDKASGRRLFDSDAAHSPAELIVRDAGTAAEEAAEAQGIVDLVAGPVFARARVRAGASCCPRITQEYVVYNGVKRVDVNVRILRDSTPMRELYLAFPFAVEDPAFLYEAPGAVIAPIEDQIPGTNTDTTTVQHWIDVAGASGGAGVTWSALDTPVAEMGGLWPGYVSRAHHGVTGPDYGHDFLETGELEKGYVYALISYNNFRTNFINAAPDEYLVRYAFTSYDEAAPDRTGRSVAASAFGWDATNPPLTVWKHGPQARALPSANALVEVDGPNVVLLTLKPAKDGRGHILRLFETSGAETEVTIRTDALPVTHAFETNLVEQDQRLLSWHAGGVTLRMKPLAMATVRLTRDLD